MTLDVSSTIFVILFSALGIVIVVYGEYARRRDAEKRARELEIALKENAIKNGIDSKSLGELVDDANKSHRNDS